MNRFVNARCLYTDKGLNKKFLYSKLDVYILAEVRQKGEVYFNILTHTRVLVSDKNNEKR
jgi:hypothetical protein